MPTCPFDALIERIWQYDRKELEESFAELLCFGETFIKKQHDRCIRTTLGEFRKRWLDSIEAWKRSRQPIEVIYKGVTFDDIKDFFAKTGREDFAQFIQRSKDIYDSLPQDEKERISIDYVGGNTSRP